MPVASTATGFTISSIFEIDSPKSGTRSPANVSPSFAQTGALVALGKIDGGLTQEAKGDEACPGVPVDACDFVDADVDSRFVFWFGIDERRGGVWLWRGGRQRVGIGRVQRGGGGLGPLRVFFRDRRIQFFDLADLAPREQDGRAQLNAGRVIHINPVGHERRKKTGRAEENQNPGQDGDGHEHQQARQDFITL